MQRVLLQLVIPASHVTLLFSVLAVLLPVQLLAIISGKTTEDCPNAWTPFTNTGNPDGVPRSELWSGPALATVVSGGVRQWMGDSLTPSCSYSHYSLCLYN